MSHQNCYEFKKTRNNNNFFNQKVNNQDNKCNTECQYPFWSKDVCCPDESLCLGSKDDVNNRSACPYDQCRVAILNTAYEWIGYVKKEFLFVQRFHYWYHSFLVFYSIKSQQANQNIFLFCYLSCSNHDNLYMFINML